VDSIIQLAVYRGQLAVCGFYEIRPTMACYLL